MKANETIYEYYDERGEYLHEKVRNQGKNFYFRRPDGNGGYVTGRGNTRRVLYNLPAVIAAKDCVKPVFYCEGEKDCESAKKYGLVATTAGGANDWKSYFKKYFSGLSVIVCEDNDESGRKSAEKICRDIYGIAASVKLLTFHDMPKGSDITDWLENGGNLAKLTDKVFNLPEWEPGTLDVINFNAIPGIDRITDEILTTLTTRTNAEILCITSGDVLRYNHKQRKWLVWDKHWWIPDNNGVPVRKTLIAARVRFHLSGRIKDRKLWEKVSGHAIRSENWRQIDDTLKTAMNLLPIADSGEGWDSDPYMFGVANGVINLKTGELLPGKPEDRITMHSPVPYDPDAKCPRWEKFLREIFDGDDEMIEFVGRALGYSMIGNTDEHVFFILHGKGSNGKSVLIEVIRYIFGDYAWDAGFEAFSNKESHAEVIANLAGKRFVTGAEVKENVHLNEQRLKALSHGDTLTAHHKYEHRFQFKPQGTIWLCLNKEPKITDDSDGFWRSMKKIPFNVQFKGDAVDIHLTEKLKEEGIGILAWAVRMCLKYQEQRGLGYNEEVMRESAIMRQDMYPLCDFTETCAATINSYTAAGDLWKEYEKFAQDERIPDRERLGQKTFYQRLADRYDRGTERISGKKTRVYYGIGLLQEYKNED